MGKETGIAWTDATFNPWWGCQRVSPGCEHCYAEAQAKRYGHAVWGPESTTARRFFGDKHWNEPRKWNADARAKFEVRRVFCASMADVFEDNRDLDGWRDRLWDLIEATPSLNWQLLTKRPENIARLIRPAWLVAAARVERLMRKVERGEIVPRRVLVDAVAERSWLHALIERGISSTWLTTRLGFTVQRSDRPRLMQPRNVEAVRTLQREIDSQLRAGTLAPPLSAIEWDGFVEDLGRKRPRLARTG
jgi:hypothetical protein